MIKRILTMGFVLLSLYQLSAQENELRFTLSKNLGEQKTVYFHIKGIQDSDMPDILLERLLSDPLIYDGRIYKTPKLQDRCQLYMSHEIDAAYIRSILQEYNLDFEYTTVSRNGHLETAHAKSSSKPGATPPSPVLMDGFPQYKDTGNPEVDQQNYSNAKQKWIEENPEAYQEYINRNR